MRERAVNHPMAKEAIDGMAGGMYSVSVVLGSEWNTRSIKESVRQAVSDGVWY